MAVGRKALVVLSPNLYYMGIGKITRNFQVTIPRDVRELRPMREGDLVMFAVEGDRVVMELVDEDPIKAAAGIWADMKEEPEEFERRLRRESEARLRREMDDD